MSSESRGKDTTQDNSSNDSLSENLSHTAGLEFLNNTIPLVPEEDLYASTHSEAEMEDAETKDDEARSEEGICAEDDSTKRGYKQIMVGKDIVEIMNLCDFCRGPIFRTCKKKGEETKFCSPRCHTGYSKAKLNGKKGRSKSAASESDNIVDLDGNEDGQSKVDFTFDELRDVIEYRGAPSSCFKRITKDVKDLKAGMKLEALDKNNPSNYCVATVINVVGHRVQICYDGFGDDEGQDFWCNFQAEELFPIGWCAGNSYPLQPPSGISSSLEDWKTFLTKTLTGALAAPVALFRSSDSRMLLHVHSFQAGTRVECIHPKSPGVISPATVTKSLGPYYYQVSTEAFLDYPPAQFFGRSETLGLFQVGWAKKHGIKPWAPSATYIPGGDDGKPCIQVRKFASDGSHFSPKRPRCNRFKVGQKLEAVDVQNQSIVRVATILWTTGRLLLLYFDGTNQFQFVDCESEDIYPCGWCKTTGHPLHTSYGIDSMVRDTSPHHRSFLSYHSESSACSCEDECQPHKKHRESFTRLKRHSGETKCPGGECECLPGYGRSQDSVTGTINVSWVMSGIEKELFDSRTNASMGLRSSPHNRWHGRKNLDASLDSLHRLQQPTNEDRTSQQLMKCMESVQDTLEEGFSRLSRHIKILSNRVAILEERIELNNMDIPKKKRKCLYRETDRQKVRVSSKTYTDSGVQTEIVADTSGSGRSTASYVETTTTTTGPDRVPPFHVSTSSCVQALQPSTLTATRTNLQVERHEHLLPQIMDIVGSGGIEPSTESRSKKFIPAAIAKTTATSIENVIYVHPGETQLPVLSRGSTPEKPLTADPVNCSVVRFEPLGVPKTALLNQTVSTSSEQDLFSGISHEQLNAVTIIYRQQSKRHEFALKILDIFYTEEEQASLKEPGGGCLRNLDLERLLKMKVTSSVIPCPEKVVSNDTESRSENANTVKLPSFKSVLRTPEDMLNKKTHRENRSKDTSKNPDFKDDSNFDPRERFCIYVNRHCDTGPFIDALKFEELPPKTAEGRLPSVLCDVIEFLLVASKDRAKIVELMQDVTGPRLFSSGKGMRLYQKSLQRYERKERAMKLLKKLSKKLQFCEYLFSINVQRACTLHCRRIAWKCATSSESAVHLLPPALLTEPKKSEPIVTLNLSTVVSTTSNIIGTAGDAGLLTHHLLYKGRPLVPIAPGMKQIGENGIAPVSGTTGSMTLSPVTLIPSAISSISSGNTNQGHIGSSQQRIAAPLNIRLLSPHAVGTPLKPLERTGGVGTLFVVKNGEARPAVSENCAISTAPIQQVLLAKDVESSHRKVSDGKTDPLMPTIYTQTTPAFTSTRSCPQKVEFSHIPIHVQSKNLPEEFIPIGVPNSLTSSVVKPRCSGDSKLISVPASAFSPTVPHFPAGLRVSSGQEEDSKKLSVGVKHEDTFPVKNSRLNISSGLLNVVKVPRFTSSQISSAQIVDNPAKVKPRSETAATVNLVQLRGLLCDKTATLNHSLHVISSSEPTTTTQESPATSGSQINSKCHLPIQLNVAPGLSSNFHLSGKRPFSVTRFTPSSNVVSAGGPLDSHKVVTAPIRGVFHNTPAPSLETQPLKVLTGNNLEAPSPLHSPPPLRPAPAGSLRTVALRSPPHLYPSATSSPRFEFPTGKPLTPVEVKLDTSCATNDMFTKGVQVSPGALKEENVPFSFSKTGDNERILVHSRALHQGLLASQRRDDGRRVPEGNAFHPHSVQDKPQFRTTQTITPQSHLHTCSQGLQAKKLHAISPQEVSIVGGARQAAPPTGVRTPTLPVSSSSSSSSPIATTTVTVTLTYVPVHSNSKDKVVYLPVNRAQNQNNQVLFYQQPGSVAVVANPMPPFVRTSVPCKKLINSTVNQTPKLSTGVLQSGPSADEASRHFETFRLQGSSFKDIESRVREAVRKEIEAKEKEDKEKKKNLKRRRSQSLKSLSNSDQGEHSVDKAIRLEEGSAMNGPDILTDSKMDEMGDANTNNLGNVQKIGLPLSSSKENSLNGGVVVGKSEQDLSYSDNSCYGNEDDEGGEFDDDDEDDDRKYEDDDEDDDKEEESGRDRKQDWRHRKRKRKSLKKRFTRRKGETTPLKLKNKDGTLSKLYDGHSSGLEGEPNSRFDGADGTNYSQTDIKRSDIVPKSEHDSPVQELKPVRDQTTSTLDAALVDKQSLIDGHLPQGLTNGIQGYKKRPFITDPLSKVKLPHNPETWSSDQVAEFIKATDCAEHATKLVDEEIDGQSLLLLTREALMEFTGMKLGPALKICSFVAQLKARLRMQQLTSSCLK